jgi:hypothetical protein
MPTCVDVGVGTWWAACHVHGGNRCTAAAYVNRRDARLGIVGRYVAGASEVAGVGVSGMRQAVRADLPSGSRAVVRRDRTRSSSVASGFGCVGEEGVGRAFSKGHTAGGAYVLTWHDVGRVWAGRGAVGAVLDKGRGCGRAGLVG